MGRYKKIVTNIAEDKRVIIEKKIDIVDIILVILLLISIVALANFKLETEKLLKQNDVLCGDLNEMKYDNELLYNAYEELKEKYEYAIEVIRTSDKYEMPEGVEE